MVRFMDEVRRAEDFAEQARVGDSTKAEMQDQLRAAQNRVMAAAAEVAKATGQAPEADAEPQGHVSRVS
jgi:hypothetical protein